MKPPICAYCRKDFRAALKEGGQVRFVNYQTLPKGKMGHPKGLGWFCNQHFESARKLKHLAMSDALKALKQAENQKRPQLLSQIAKQILKHTGIVKVAIDGVDGAGKTIFANELSDTLKTLSQRQIIRASVDDFHNPRSVRYAQGKTSAKGFFEDSYNYPALKERLLEPLNQKGKKRFYTSAFDHVSNHPMHPPEQIASEDVILLLDGIFLHRPELRAYWDYSIFLDVPFEVSVPRGNSRTGGPKDPNAAENQRYVQGQKLYVNTCKPKNHATVIINNANLKAPFIVPKT